MHYQKADSEWETSKEFVEVTCQLVEVTCQSQTFKSKLELIGIKRNEQEVNRKKGEDLRKKKKSKMQTHSLLFFFSLR